MANPENTGILHSFFAKMGFKEFKEYFKANNFEGDPEIWYEKWTGKKLKIKKDES